jgi:hypothetical protein
LLSVWAVGRDQERAAFVQKILQAAWDAIERLGFAKDNENGIWNGVVIEVAKPAKRLQFESVEYESESMVAVLERDPGRLSGSKSWKKKEERQTSQPSAVGTLRLP